MNKRIIYINNDGFPNGMASASRILSLARGFVANGYNVNVLCVRPTEKKNNIVNKNSKGIIKGVEFCYTAKTVIWPNNKFLQLYLYFKGIINCILIAKKLNPRAIIVQPDSFSIILLLRIFFNKSILYKALDEYPPPILRNKTKKLWDKLYMKYYYNFFQCVICITESLSNFLKDHCNVKNTLIVNMIVEIDRFNVKADYIQKCICYAGNMGMNNKDGVSDLILAFAKISDKHKDWILKLIGDDSKIEPKDRIYIENILDKYNVRERVIFFGKTTYENIPNLLAQASILALARPANKQSEVSFPTKLGEYLAVGRPVLVTNVGEIGKFIINGYNGYLAEPSNTDDIANKLDYIISHPNEWEYITTNAKKLVEEQFNNINESKKIISYIEKNYD